VLNTLSKQCLKKLKIKKLKPSLNHLKKYVVYLALLFFSPISFGEMIIQSSSDDLIVEKVVYINLKKYNLEFNAL
jgi:hypothetical protein